MPITTTTPHDVVFLFDCDNTLLDNDHVLQDLRAHMMGQFGEENSARYWEIFENLRRELGYADYLGALQRYRTEHPRDTRLLLMSSFLIEYPFANRLYPGALDALRHVGKHGPTVILSDGDVVFQPRKIKHAGIWSAVDGAVLIYVHKEKVLDHVQRRYPASHYVVVDDKPNLLAAMKTQLGPRLTTVFVRQGHYALAAGANSTLPPPDRTIERIGELVTFRSPDFEVQP
jgi:FMN phosphatase YigB (HAD superfamily)